MPTTCCTSVVSLGGRRSAVSSGSEYWTDFPYWGALCIYGECSGLVGRMCLNLCRACLIYSGIESRTVLLV